MSLFHTFTNLNIFMIQKESLFCTYTDRARAKKNKNKNIDIRFTAHDAFLKSPSSCDAQSQILFSNLWEKENQRA